jgi:broad specificity phosphatase PhoE
MLVQGLLTLRAALADFPVFSAPAPAADCTAAARARLRAHLDSGAVACVAFVRHAATGRPRDDSRDADMARELTAAGKAQARAAGGQAEQPGGRADGWLALLPPVGLVCTSEAARCCHTATLLLGTAARRRAILCGVYDGTMAPGARAAFAALGYAPPHAYRAGGHGAALDAGAARVLVELADAVDAELSGPPLNEEVVTGVRRGGTGLGTVLVFGHAVHSAAAAQALWRAAGGGESASAPPPALDAIAHGEAEALLVARRGAGYLAREGGTAVPGAVVEDTSATLRTLRVAASACNAGGKVPRR